MKKIIIHSFLVFILFSQLTQCTDYITSDTPENSLVIDHQEFNYSVGENDSTYICDITYQIIFHFENSGGNLSEYKFSVNHDGVVIGTGWEDRDSYRPFTTGKFLKEMERDTLIYQDSFSTPLSENFDRYFKFQINGYYYDVPLSLTEINEDLNLEGFFYFYTDTIKLY